MNENQLYQPVVVFKCDTEQWKQMDNYYVL